MKPATVEPPTSRASAGTACYAAVPSRDELIDSYVRYEKYAKRTGQTVVELPFPCHWCNQPKTSLSMIDGDGFPICVDCFEGFVSRVS